jgi:threonine synthase
VIKDSKNTVLVASGDTGGAVASGFLGVKGVEVIILPIGESGDIQERQLTTLGQNIKALEVDMFDDCQDMVKKAFLDETQHHNLTSANSINIARWLPHVLLFLCLQSLEKQNKPWFSLVQGTSEYLRGNYQKKWALSHICQL